MGVKNDSEWAGTASSWFDTFSVARDLLQGLLFAEQVVSEANAVIVILDRKGKIQRFNRLCEEYTDVKEQDVIGKTAFELFLSAQERLRVLTNTDIITGLPNRHAINEHIRSAIETRKPKEQIGLVYFDLDNFKKVNDAYGHVFGDQRLQSVALSILSCLIDNAEQALDVIEPFRSLGAQIHLDDFGTGYSSLSQLARFPIETIKLDHIFVQSIHDRSVSQSLVLAIIAVARALNRYIIAEGVEDTADDAFLRLHGADERQGYLFARPMPVAELERWLKEHPGL